MIEHIRTLKREIASKRIYVWDIGKCAMRTFARLAYRGFNVEGFVTNIGEYIGESIMNRPIISLEEFSEASDAVVILDDDFGNGTLALASTSGKAFRIRDALALNPKLGEFDLLLYGFDDAWVMLQELGPYNSRVEAIVQEGYEGIPHVAELPIRPFDIDALGSADAIVVSPCYGRRAAGISAKLQCQDYRGTLFVRELIPFEEFTATDPVVAIDRALKTGRRIITCFDDPFEAQILNAVLARHGVTVSRAVTFEGDPERGIDDIWSLAGEDPAGSTLIAHASKSSRVADITETARDLGFRIEDGSFSGICRMTYRRRRVTDELPYEHDSLVGASLDFTPVGGEPGWAVFGSPETAEHRIMVLGGSTSAEVYFATTWVEHLYRLLCKNGIETAIFNGAHESNGVAEELDRLTRDLALINPDLVISMSGFNDLRPSKDKFTKRSAARPFERWRRMEGYMKAVVESTGAVFLPILQPINSWKEEFTLHELMQFVFQAHHRTSDFMEARGDDFYLNLLRLFHDGQGMFVDCCHYSDAGAARIAEAVYGAVREALPQAPTPNS